MSRVLLAADIGNTNVTLGLFRGGRLVRRGRLETDTKRGRGSYKNDLAKFIKGTAGVRCVFGSVVPKLSRPFSDAARALTGSKPVEVSARSPLGIRLRVDHPNEVGADRILNGIAAVRRYGGPAVVIDYGTATTFDCLSKRGDYLGGAILPGPRVAADALSLKAAKVPNVEIRRTRRVIGKNTVDCLQAGIFFGYIGMVERVLKETVAEMRSSGTAGKGRIRVIATGGLASLFKKALPRGTVIDPDLTLWGLWYAANTIC